MWLPFLLPVNFPILPKNSKKLLAGISRDRSRQGCVEDGAKVVSLVIVSSAHVFSIPLTFQKAKIGYPSYSDVSVGSSFGDHFFSPSSKTSSNFPASIAIKQSKLTVDDGGAEISPGC